MAAVIEQQARFISLDTPLGEDVLVLQSFSGMEELSQLYHYQLEMLSDEHGIEAADIVGSNVTFSIRLADGSRRYFNGHVSRFTAGAMMTREHRSYQAEVVPWFWFLTRTSDCRIFQNKAVPDIVEEIFGDLGFADYELDLRGDHAERTYCVQYRESAFNFISRLLEEEGIFYWFRHEEGKHTLVLADYAGDYEDCPEHDIAHFPGSLEDDHITSWEHQYEFRSGKYTQTDFNFETPSIDLNTSTKTLIKIPGMEAYELYDYWGRYQDKDLGETLTKLRMEAEEVPHDTVRCESTCRTLHAAGKFAVARHDCPSEEGKEYVVASIYHSAGDTTQTSGGGEHYYQNSFSCIPATVVFRPACSTPRPEIKGPQTATVTGPSGEEIYTDKHGRIKVQFHWDRLGQRDENSSCWIRVSQVHAGKAFGGIDIPRVDEEVIVEFLEADPDRPIVTGRVYNGEQTPPFPLPDSKVVSGMKSNSSKGGGGHNEFSLNDTKNQEKITIHGQHDMDTTVQNDRSATVVSGNDTLAVQSGTQSVTVKGNTSLTVEAGDRIVDVTGNYKLDTTSEVSIQAPGKISLTCGGSSIVMVPGKITITAGGGASITLDGNALAESSAGSKVKLDGNALTESSGGSKVLLDANALMESSAGDKVELNGNATMSSPGEAKVDAPTAILSGGGSTVTNDASGVAATGAKISLNG